MVSRLLGPGVLVLVSMALLCSSVSMAQEGPDDLTPDLLPGVARPAAPDPPDTPDLAPKPVDPDPGAADPEGPFGDDVPRGDFPEDRLFRALTAGLEANKQQALIELEGHGQDPRVADLLIRVLEKARTDGAVPQSTLWMLINLGKFTEKPEVLKMMLDLADSDNPKVVMVAADTLGEIGDPKALDKLLALKDQPEFEKLYGFRRCVMLAVMKIQDPRAVEFVIEQLPTLTGQLQFDAVRYLSHVSAQRFASRSEDWATWWEDNCEDFMFASGEPFSPESGLSESSHSGSSVWDLEAAEFFGTYIYAKRMIFVLDISSSMGAPASMGTRLDLAKKELIEAIQPLPEDTYFTILVFDAGVGVWKRSLVRATEKNRELATIWVKRIAMGRGTNSYEALIRAFAADGNAEAIFFLSDGKPSKGRITDPAQILREVRLLNFFRRVSIYTFGFVGQGEQFMRNLAATNNGEFKAIQ